MTKRYIYAIDVMKSLEGEKVMKKVTQRTRVLRHLEDYGSITTWQAYSEYSGLNIISMLLYLYGIESPSKSGLSNHLPVINYLD